MLPLITIIGRRVLSALCPLPFLVSFVSAPARPLFFHISIFPSFFPIFLHSLSLFPFCSYSQSLDCKNQKRARRPGGQWRFLMNRRARRTVRRTRGCGQDAKRVGRRSLGCARTEASLVANAPLGLRLSIIWACRSTGRAAAGPLPRLHDRRQSEVRQLHVAARVEQQVVGLDVAVDDPNDIHHVYHESERRPGRVRCERSDDYYSGAAPA